MMIPPFAVSTCSRRRTSTRSCSGVILIVIFLSSIPLLPNPRHLIFFSYLPTLRAKCFLVLQPLGFQVVRFFFLEVGVALGLFLFFEGHSVCNGKLRLRVNQLGEDDEAEMVGKRGTDQL